MTRSEASRQNGAKSKGPTTPEGKARSSQNARKHGYFSKANILLAGEDLAEYNALRQDYLEIYQPRNAEEADLVLDIVNARWRLRRAENDYARLIDIEQDNPENNWDETFSKLYPHERAALALDAIAARSPSTLLMIHRTENTCHRVIFKAMKTLRDLRKDSPPVQTPPPEPQKSSNEPEPPPSQPCTPPNNPDILSSLPLGTIHVGFAANGDRGSGVHSANLGVQLPMTAQTTSEFRDDLTQPGNYFVSNYPPYSFWNAASTVNAHAVLDAPPLNQSPLGIYIHIPFCRKRCHFCYFKVYTDKNSTEVDGYIDSVIEELTIYARKPFIGGRKPTFIYFGGGTPSYISSTQLTRLVESMKNLLGFEQAQEVAFECEPGTITETKLRVIKDLGVTRLSLGIENFDDEILKVNGRAHASKEIGRAYDLARTIGFAQINIDLIAGMVGETEENWKECVRKTIAMSPESITIYQMEVPYNTTIFKEMKVYGESSAPVASWKTKREWVAYAFAEFEKNGYTVGSAYTAVKDPAHSKFLYRDLLWAGADMVGLGVASFSHVQGTHFQNDHDFESYRAKLAQGQLPIFRALTPSAEDRLIRELVLQLKLGRVQTAYFQEKFGVDIRQQFAHALTLLQDRGFLTVENGTVRLNRDGLLQVDRLLPEFFKPEHRVSRRV